MPPKKVLYAFVDLKDPFVQGEVFDELLPGPILSILGFKRFDEVVLFHTPHTVEQTEATRAAVHERFPDCQIVIEEIPTSDPKDCSTLMGSLARFIRDRDPRVNHHENFVCVSSGTAEMRAAWFLLSAIGLLPSTFLQLGSPAHPLFGPAKVKEVRLDSTPWLGPGVLLGDAASDTGQHEFEVFDGFGDADDSRLSALDDVLLELNLHVGSASLRYAAQQAAIAAESPLPVLLTGETGTGKERFGHLIHRLSPRCSRPLVPVNCAAIPETLAETYLFGHTKGAFSDATADKPGIFETADHTTLFLDEIAELSLGIQAKLLRVIQDGFVQRIGSSHSRRVDVRIVAATNRDLKRQVAEGRFREDLYFRLEVVQIHLPALRDRRTEIPELALTLLKQINQRRQRPRQLSTAALRRLEQYHWPGNVRQLSNVLERSVLYSRSDLLDSDDLIIADEPSRNDALAALPDPCEGFSLEDYLDQARKQLYLRALAISKNNQALAAALLGVSKQAVSRFVSGLNDNQD